MLQGARILFLVKEYFQGLCVMHLRCPVSPSIEKIWGSLKRQPLFLCFIAVPRKLNFNHMVKRAEGAVLPKTFRHSFSSPFSCRRRGCTAQRCAGPFFTGFRSFQARCCCKKQHRNIQKISPLTPIVIACFKVPDKTK